MATFGRTWETRIFSYGIKLKINKEVFGLKNIHKTEGAREQNYD